MKKYVFVAVLLGVYYHLVDGNQFGSARADYASAGNDVVLYATAWCGYCRKTRELLRKHKIDYVEYDIEKSARGAAEHKRLGGRGVPLLKINGRIIHGYDRRAILAAMKSD